MSWIRAVPLAMGVIALLALGLPLGSEAATFALSIHGVQGDDGGGTPNPTCTGSATCAFSPNPLTIAVGDSINVTNVGGLQHTYTGPTTFTPTLSTIRQPGGACPAPSNGNCFSTALLNPGQSRLIGPFPNTSDFDTYCLNHGASVMVGHLTVGGGGGTTTTTTATTTTTGATTTTTAATTTTTAATTTTTGATTTTTGATTTTTGATTTTAPTTTTTAATTTTTAAGCVHSVSVSVPPQPPQPQFHRILPPRPVNPIAILTNTGTCPSETMLLTMGITTSPNTGGWQSARSMTVGGGSVTVTFDAYATSPLANSVNVNVNAASGTAPPASGSNSYPTVL